MSLIGDKKTEPARWYFDHLVAPDKSCWCGTLGPERSCDVGEALYRLRQVILRAAPPEHQHPRRRRF